MGHPKVISDLDCVARSRVTLDKQIRAFKTQVRRVADRILIGSEDRDLFKPYLHHKQNLPGTAILGIHPSLRFNVCLPDATRLQLAGLLVTLSRKCSRSKVSDFIAGTHRLLPVAVKRKGKPHGTQRSRLPTGLIQCVRATRPQSSCLVILSISCGLIATKQRCAAARLVSNKSCRT